MFDQFPKTRQPLPEAYARIYEAHYKENRKGGTPALTLSHKMERWLHWQIARDPIRPGQSTLEIGAGTLNHLPYEPELGPYDIVEPFRELYETSGDLRRIRNIYGDIGEIPPGGKYDRIITIATFEHVCNLPEVVARAALLLNPGGMLRVSIPSEGTILWTLGWKLTTGIEFRARHRLDYGFLMRYEHINTAREIEEVLRHFFSDVRTSVFGLCRALSFYQAFRCANPAPGPCREYLEGIGARMG